MSPKNEQKHTDGGVAWAQERGRERLERGYDGVVPDPTPNENYTVAGNDLPTPETDRDMKLAADARSREIEEAYADVRPVPELEKPAKADDKSAD